MCGKLANVRTQEQVKEITRLAGLAAIDLHGTMALATGEQAKAALISEAQRDPDGACGKFIMQADAFDIDLFVNAWNFGAHREKMKLGEPTSTT